MDGKIRTNAQHEEKVTLGQIPVAVILTDEAGVVRRLNPQAEILFAGGLPAGSLLSDLMDLTKTRVLIGGKTFGITTAPFDCGEFSGAIHVLQNLESVLQEESANSIREASEMVAEIAHEIRNPLGSIELFASLLRKTAAGEKELNRINQIITSVKTINGRISELLSLSKKRALRRQIFSLNRLIREIFRIPGQTDSFLTLSFGDAEMNVNGDEKILRQMFLSLLVQMLQTHAVGSEAGGRDGDARKRGRTLCFRIFYVYGGRCHLQEVRSAYGAESGDHSQHCPYAQRNR